MEVGEVDSFLNHRPDEMSQPRGKNEHGPKIRTVKSDQNRNMAGEPMNQELRINICPYRYRMGQNNNGVEI
jgi:hypothetical protein